MNLHVVDPEKSETISVAWLEVNTPVGNFVIQPGHVPTVLTLTKERPVILALENGKFKTLSVVNGLVKVTREDVTLFAQQVR